jgi:hypothetical protein
MDIKSRFIFTTDISALIADYMFYTVNADEIDQWLEDRGCERTGMVIKFKDEKTKTMFIMRWA